MTTNTRANVDTTASRPPVVYWVWLAGVAVTMLGTQALAFGLVWQAADTGPALASAISFAVIAPRVALSLPGGGLADRLGPGRIMIASDAVMATLVGSLALLAWNTGPSPYVILSCALALGLADAFYLPASGAMPKFLVTESQLPKAMAARQLVAQATALIGPALGGIVAAVGIALSLGVGALGFACMLAVLLIIRRHLPMAPVAGSDHESLLARARAAASTAWKLPPLRVATILTTGFSLFILPLSSLLIPLFGKANTWAPTTTGIVMGAYGAGMAAISTLVLLRTASQKAGLVAATGIALAGIGTLGIMALDHAWVAGLFALVTGIGAGLFATHLGPMFVKTAPRERMASLQSILILAQNVPLLAATPLIGLVATTSGAGIAMLVWGLGSLILGFSAILSKTVRGSGL